MATSVDSQVLPEGHTDIAFSFSNNEWSAELQFGDFDNPDSSSALNEASLTARDLPAGGTGDYGLPQFGDRFIKPSGILDFTGVGDREPIWILPQSDVGYTWPGLRNDQTPGTFRSFDPVDSRLDTSEPDQPWITIRLIDMNYAGSATNPQFSLWQFQGDFIPWMTTADGIDGTDLFYLEENTHKHMNWGFSDLGLYRIALKPSAILDGSGVTVEGDVQNVSFAIGTKATWLATHYSGDDLFTDSVSGDDSDSDQDGIRLLLEYAFNLDPVVAEVGFLEPSVGTSGLPAVQLITAGSSSKLEVEYLRRKASTNPQISYFAEFSDDLSTDGWIEQTIESVTSIDDDWERVTVSDTLDTSSAKKRFARVRVELQDTISY